MAAPRRILIADDDVDALRLVGLMLERQGFEIIAAANGQQALEKAVETQPHLIILDVMMPDMDGYEVATKLRSHPATESIPILMFTAKAAVNDKIAGFQAGVDDYLTKPVHPRELSARVEALLERHPPSTEVAGKGHIIGFLPTKGGLGTSMLALNTAIELRQMHNNTAGALVELHDGGGTAALQLGLETPKGLSALLDQPLSYITEATLLGNMIEHASGLKMLFATTKPHGLGPRLDKPRVRTILRYLSNRFDYVILDLPPDLGEPHLEALRLCESILLTVEPNRVGMVLAQEMLIALDKLNVASQKARIILIHRLPAPGSLSRSAVEQKLHREMIAGIPPVPDLALESIQNGKSIVEMQPHGLVTQQVRRVVQSIVTD